MNSRICVLLPVVFAVAGCGHSEPDPTQQVAGASAQYQRIENDATLPPAVQQAVHQQALEHSGPPLGAGRR